MFAFMKKMKTLLPASSTIPGRAQKIEVPEQHFVNGNRIVPPFPAGMAQAVFGMGCFWGAERKFWQLPGVYTTAVGYAAGVTPKPAMTLTLSLTISSCAIRLVLSGTAPSSLRMTSIFLPATVSPFCCM